MPPIALILNFNPRWVTKMPVQQQAGRNSTDQEIQDFSTTAQHWTLYNTKIERLATETVNRRLTETSRKS